MRAYAVGDIHGRLDLLDTLLARIAADNARREAVPAFLIFLGDLIDRGPDSAGVVERLRRFADPAFRPVFLLGNHEEILLRAFAGEPGLVEDWLRFGGNACAASYGADPARLAAMEAEAAAAELRRCIPDDHLAFLRSFGDTFRFGDYLFVHAGVRPGVALDRQSLRDLRWIREPFLSDTKQHGFVVVHGHTIVEEALDLGNRIAIDTGGYQSGVLTAVRIEGEERSFLSTAAPAAV